MGQIDTFDVPSTAIPPGSTINSVKLSAWCGVSRVGGWFRLVLYTHGTLYYGPTITPPDTYWQFIEKTWTNNPNTGSPWTIAELNAMEIGVDLQSKRSGPYSYGTWCTQVYATIDYDLPTGPPGGRINVFNRRPTGPQL